MYYKPSLLQAWKAPQKAPKTLHFTDALNLFAIIALVPSRVTFFLRSLTLLHTHTHRVKQNSSLFLSVQKEKKKRRVCFFPPFRSLKLDRNPAAGTTLTTTTERRLKRRRRNWNIRSNTRRFSNKKSSPVCGWNGKRITKRPRICWRNLRRDLLPREEEEEEE